MGRVNQSLPCPICGLENSAAPKVPYLPPPIHFANPADNCFAGKSVAVCPQCHTGYLCDEISPEALNTFYGKVAQIAQEQPTSHEPYPELNSRFLSQALYLKSHIPLRDRMKVLEIGSSDAGVLPTLSQFFQADYFYFDQKESATIKRWGGTRLGAFASEKALREHVPRESMDLVYMSHSLEHISPSELPALLEAIYATLKPGGHFFAEVPAELPPQGLPTGLLPPHTIFFRLSSLKHSLEAQKFKVVAAHEFGQVAEKERTDQLAPHASPAQPTLSLKKMLLGAGLRFAFLRNLLRPRYLAGALKSLRTPYEAHPYLRVIGLK